MKSGEIMAVMCLLSGLTMAEEVLIEGNINAKCVITTDTAGTYGNPNAYTLSTTPADGGVLPIVRYDVSIADSYKAQITHPSSFSTSPTLNDVPTFTGTTEVSAVGDAGMAGYEAAKVEFGNTTEFDLTVAGSTWFKTSSSVTNGGSKAFPAGTYRAVVTAECIAK